MSENNAQSSCSGDHAAMALLIAAKAYSRGLGDREPAKDEALAALREMSEGIDISAVRFGDELYADTPLRRLVEISFAPSSESHWSEAVRRFVSGGEFAASAPIADEAPLASSQTIEDRMAQRGEGTAFWVILTLGAIAALGLWIWGKSVTSTSKVLQPSRTAISAKDIEDNCRIIRLTIAMSAQAPTAAQDSELGRCK